VAGFIIGRKGATVRELESSTGARIVIDDKVPTKEVASITASTKAVLDAAVAKVKAAVTEARTAPPRPSPAFILQVPLTVDQAGAVIGKGGATIQEIRAKTGANVKVVSRNRTQVASIEAADARSGEAAEREVRRIIASASMGAERRDAPPGGARGGANGGDRDREEGFTTVGGDRAATRGEKGAVERSPRSAPPSTSGPSRSLRLPDPTLTVVLVGPRGVTVRSLEEETGATIDVDRITGGVTVSGPTKDVVEAACARVLATVSGVAKCSSGTTCGGWAKVGELYCPRCSRARTMGEAGDEAGFQVKAGRAANSERREKGVAAARDAKTAGRS
jgi:polyribonucleotide nucleotidyltransferase